MSAKPQVPAIEGWHTMDTKPHLIGTRCKLCGTYFFPKQDDYCKNPQCDSTDFDEVELSRTGHDLELHQRLLQAAGTLSSHRSPSNPTPLPPCNWRRNRWWCWVRWSRA